MKCSLHALLCAAALALVASAGQAQGFMADLNGASEAPPNASPGTGTALVSINPFTHIMHVQVTFADLIGTTTASHIHGPTALPGTGTAGVATTTPTFPGFPLGVTSGSYDHYFDMLLPSSYNPSFLNARGGDTALAEADLFAAISAGQAYLNVHTTFRPGGEIRGFLVQAVPEPGSLGLLAGLGACGLRWAVRRRRPAG